MSEANRQNAADSQAQIASIPARRGVDAELPVPHADAELLRPGWFQPWMARHWQKLLAALFWLILIAGYLWFARANNLGPLESVQRLAGEMQNSIYGPLIYWLVYALRPLIFFPAMLLSISAGFLFGPVIGVLLTIIAANTSALVAYWIGRYFGQDLLDKPDSASLFQRYALRMRRNSFETVLLMRFTFLPFDVVNYLAGLLRINWKAYLLATALGSIPGTISFVLFGASIERLDGGMPTLNPWVLAISAAIFAVSFGLSRLLRRRDAARAQHSDE